ncbi:MAG: hypothetical protein WBV46_20365 [Terriglobales bacterium]|jgi:hypothetical protein
MAKEENSRLQRPAASKYRRVEVSSLDRGRRGKHHELVEGILKELQIAEPDSALEIPLTDVGGIGLANLRSAVHRGASSAGITIETLADDKNFYVWKATA